MYWSFPKLKVKTLCTPNSNVGNATLIQQLLEEGLLIKKCHSKTYKLLKRLQFYSKPLRVLIASFQIKFAFHLKPVIWFQHQIKYDWFLYRMERFFSNTNFKSIIKHHLSLIKLFTEKKWIIYSTVAGEVHV